MSDRHNRDKNYSTVIKVDLVSQEGAERIVEGAKRAAREHTPGARGTFIVTPTAKLRGSDGQREIAEGSRNLLEATQPTGDPQCKGKTSDGQRCTHRARAGNYGFCKKHR